MKDTIILWILKLMIKITNSVTGAKEVFKPLKPDQVTLYVCGVTPYDYSHVGHGRCYITFDILVRLLKFFGYNVTYVRNFTDIDDKLLMRAQKEFGDKHRYPELAQKFIDAYHNDMKVLGNLEPTVEPRVTETISEIIAFIQGLIDQGKAYAVDGDVYFDISNFPEYGKLAKHKLEDLHAGQRVEINTKKKNPLDFALWKREPEGEFWKSPWGYGRPGWHIECSAMAKKYLGDTIDIHAGGQDLIFPHHENEIAQSEGLNNKTFANYWMHNGFVRINEEKMSKSFGNFFTLKEVFKKFDPMVVRFYILNHHYRAPLDFSFEELESIQKSYQKLIRAFAHCDVNKFLARKEISQFPVIKKMLEFLCDDLNTTGMLGVIFEHLDEITKDSNICMAVKTLLGQVLGLSLQPLPEKKVKLTSEIQKLIDDREKARAQKDWAKADTIRDKLKALGFDVSDKKIS